MLALFRPSAGEGMNSDDLKLFARVVAAGSMSRAAIDTGSDASTVSRRMSALEGELGVRLFHRSGRGVVPTERGRALGEFAAQVDGMLAEAVRVVGAGAGEGPERLHIAAQPTIAQMLFAPLAQAFRREFPRTRLRLVEALASQILEQLASGELDLAILYLPEHTGATRYDLLFTEELRLVTPADYPVTSDPLPLARLADIPLILPSTHHGLRVLAETLAARNGFALQIALECDASIALTRRLVMHGCGCTLLPIAAVADELAAGQLGSCRLDPPLSRSVGLAHGRNRVTPSGLWAAERLLRTTLDKLVASGDWPDARLP